MIYNTFSHIKGVSSNFEKNLWNNGILTWDDFLKNYDVLNIGSKKKEFIKDNLVLQNNLVLNNDFSFMLPHKKLHWRLLKLLKDNTCYLDIETTGLNKTYDKITTIGVHSNKETRVFVRNDDLHDFKDYVKNFKAIVTFNGACFDLPFLKNKMGINFDDFIHLDLRFLFANVDYTGGLKSIEKQLGVVRDDDLDGVDGFEAVRLWKRFERYGDEAALKKLIKYNKADVENLPELADIVFEKLKQKHFLEVINNS